MILVSSCICLCPIYWSRVLSREWRCSWSSADRRCSNYIWVINNLIAYKGASYIRNLTVVQLHVPSHCWHMSKYTNIYPCFLKINSTWKTVNTEDVEKICDMQNFYFLWQLTKNSTDHFIIKQWDISNPGVCKNQNFPLKLTLNTQISWNFICHDSFLIYHIILIFAQSTTVWLKMHCAKFQNDLMTEMDG